MGQVVGYLPPSGRPGLAFQAPVSGTPCLCHVDIWREAENESSLSLCGFFYHSERMKGN